jgi:hypothetical protein
VALVGGAKHDDAIDNIRIKLAPGPSRSRAAALSPPLCHAGFRPSFVRVLVYIGWTVAKVSGPHTPRKAPNSKLEASRKHDWESSWRGLERDGMRVHGNRDDGQGTERK